MAKQFLSLPVSQKSGTIRLYAILTASLLAALSANGCASVKLAPVETFQPAARSVSTGHSERQALVSATRELKQTPWPDVTETSLTERMVSILFGGDEEETGMTRDEALQLYVSSLKTDSASPVILLTRHADNTLRSARNVAESGRLAATAINPDTDDIAVLEDAIADIRFSRDMYISAMKMLKSDGYDVSGDEMDEIRAAFSQTIRDIGTTADAVAERAMSPHQTSQLASTPSSGE